MAKKTVLAIGIEPALADLAAIPQFTPELVRSYIDARSSSCAPWDTMP
jgi:hypothetical protein